MDLCECINIRMIHPALRLARPLYDLPLVTMNMVWLSKWHHKELWISVLFLVEDGSISAYTVTQDERSHTKHFAFNKDSTEHMHSLVIALKSLIADADASADKNDICEHLLWKLKLALERNIDFVFCLRGPIRANRFTQPDQSENNNSIAVISLVW